MIKINKLEILNNGTQLGIDVETTPGYIITSLLFWNMDDFKDYNLAIDLTGKLEQINNREVLLFNIMDLEVGVINNICFVEIESNAPSTDECEDCSRPVLGIAYELSQYYRCLMNYLLEGQLSQCTSCNDVQNKDIQLAISVNLLIDTVSKAIDAGFYQQAIDMIKDLQSLCNLKNCKDCDQILCNTCNKFKQQ